MTSKESDRIFDEATRIAGAYRAGQKPLVRGKPGCDPLGEEDVKPETTIPGTKIEFDSTGTWYRYVPEDKPPTKSVLPDDNAARKTYPMYSGLLAYFPDACAEVAHVSYAGSKQHHPDKPMHWDRAKSMDQEDCIVRHLTQRGTRDIDGQRHSAKLAWRALAMLQLEIENEKPRPYKIHGYTQMPSPTSPYHDDATEIP